MNLQANLHDEAHGGKTGQLDYELMDYAPMVMVQVDSETQRVQAYLRRGCTEDGDQIIADYHLVSSECFDLSMDVSKVCRMHTEHRLKQVAAIAA